MTHSAAPLDEQLDELIAQYLEAEEAGVPFDTSRVPAATLAELTRFAESHRRLRRFTQPLRVIAESIHDTSSLRRDVGEGDSRLLSLPVRFGSYELIERLGQGGMGVVFKARQNSPRRLVAIKITRPDYLAQSEIHRRFRNEAELAARLDHPGIVPVYEVGYVDQRSYFSMKLLEGGNLARHLPRFRHDSRAIAQLMVTVSRAVHHAHQRGVLHRDLKPSNILLDSAGGAHVTDFGLARSLPGGDPEETMGDVTRPGMLIGTPSYMAPEQLTGTSEMLTTATDVYGLGAVMFTLLTGQPPFRGDSPLDTLMLARQGDPPLPRQLDSSIPRDLETICLKALARRPGDRYASAEALLEDLERWLAGEPIAARPTSGVERAWQWCRRYPAMAALSVVATGLLLALVISLSAGIVLLRNERNGVIRQQRIAEQHEQQAVANAQALRRNLYAAQINQAWQLWQAGDLWRMRELLDQQIPTAGQEDLRGFEYYYLRETCLKPRLESGSVAAHEGPAFAVTWSSDGKLLATAGGDRQAAVWDSRTRQRLFTLPGRDDDQNCVAFDPRGEILVTGSEDGFLWTWDVATGQRRSLQARFSAAVLDVEFSRDGKLLAIALGDGQVLLYSFPVDDRASFDPPKVELAGHDKSAESVSFSSDGLYLASSARDGMARIWDVATGDCLHVLRHYSEVKSIAFANHRSLVATGDYEGIVWIWDATTGISLRQFRHPGGHCQSVAFSPDDNSVAACYQSGSVCRWPADGGPPVVFMGCGLQCWSVAYAPDGQTLAAGDHEGRVLFWKASVTHTHRSLCTGTGSGPFRDHLFLDHGRKIALVADDDSVWIVEAGSGRILQKLNKGQLCPDRIACSADERTLAISYEDGSIQLWDTASGACRQTVSASTTWSHGIALAPDGGSILSVSGGSGVFDTSNGRRLGTVKLDGAEMVSLAASGNTLATLHANGRVAIWDLRDLATPRRVLPPQLEPLEVCLALSRDEQVLAIPGDGVIDLWHCKGTRLRSISIGTFGLPRSLAFSPDGRTLAEASGFAPEIRLWHVASGQVLLTISLPENARHVSFPPDGRTLLASFVRSLWAWDVRSQEE